MRRVRHVIYCLLSLCIAVALFCDTIKQYITSTTTITTTT